MFWKKKLKERKIKIPVEACEWMIEGNRPQIGHHIESNLQPLTYFKKIHYLVSSWEMKMVIESTQHLILIYVWITYDLHIRLHQGPTLP